MHPQGFWGTGGYLRSTPCQAGKNLAGLAYHPLRRSWSTRDPDRMLSFLTRGAGREALIVLAQRVEGHLRGARSLAGDLERQTAPLRHRQQGGLVLRERRRQDHRLGSSRE